MNYLYRSNNKVQVSAKGVSVIAEGKNADMIAVAASLMLLSFGLAAIIYSTK